MVTELRRTYPTETWSSCRTAGAPLARRDGGRGEGPRGDDEAPGDSHGAGGVRSAGEVVLMLYTASSAFLLLHTAVDVSLMLY